MYVSNSHWHPFMFYVRYHLSFPHVKKIHCLWFTPMNNDHLQFFIIFKILWHKQYFFMYKKGYSYLTWVHCSKFTLKILLTIHSKSNALLCGPAKQQPHIEFSQSVAVPDFMKSVNDPTLLPEIGSHVFFYGILVWISSFQVRSVTLLHQFLLWISVSWGNPGFVSCYSMVIAQISQATVFHLFLYSL